METASLPNTAPATEGLTTSLRFIPLPEGVYSFKVRSGANSTSTSEEIQLPAVQVGVAPMHSGGTVEFITRNETTDRWLVRSRDMIIAKISGGGASLVLTSLSAPSSPELAINIRRLEADPFPADSVVEPVQPTDAKTLRDFPAQIVAHIHRLGDIPFDDGWAGCVGDGLWIEAFAVASAGHLTSDLIEYCGITADGFQTPWIGSGMFCGSRGRAIPMLAYAIRLRAEARERFDCSYIGHFVSGRVLGPFQNGDMCCSDLPSDPLWGIELRVAERSEVGGAKPGSDAQDIQAG